MVDVRPKRPATPATPAPAQLDASLAGGRVWIDVEVPRTSPVVRGVMRRLTLAEETQVSFELGAFLRVLEERGQPPMLRHAIDAQETLLTMAIAIRDGRETDRPLATVEQWEGCDDDQMGALAEAYRDLRARTNFTGSDRELTPSERLQITDAIKKKDSTLLRSFGVAKLVAFAITSADPPAS
jgi:hypothetical protein